MFIGFVILIVFFNQVSRSLSGFNFFYSKPEAVRTCRAFNGSLPNITEFMGESLALELINELNNGESAWLKGFVKFSDPVSFRGCYTGRNRKILSERIGKTGLDACISDCLNSRKYTNFHTKYVGVVNDSCSCFKDLRRMKAIKDSECNFGCFNHDINSCGGINAISVYKVYRSALFVWAETEPSQRQCIYFHANVNKTEPEAYTTSCYTMESSVKIDGYFCENSDYSQLDRRCWNRDESKRYCFKPGTVTRQAARDSCLNFNGRLAEPDSKIPVSELVKENQNYWLGVYRPFSITERRSRGSACLAVTKVHDKLYIDPDNCYIKKHFICVRNGYRESNTVSTFFEDTSLTTEELNFEIKSTLKISVTALVISIISIVVLIGFAIVIAVFVKKQNNDKREKLNEPIYLTPIEPTSYWESSLF